MPKTLTPALRAHLEEETTRLAARWRIHEEGRRDNSSSPIMTSDIVFGGDTANDVLGPCKNHWFASGALTFETGSNAGRTLEIKSWTQTSRDAGAVGAGQARRPGRGPVAPLRRVQQARDRGLPRQVPDPRQSPVHPWQRQELSG